MEYFDAHAHYDDEKFDIDREDLIQKMYNENVTKIISAGYSLEGSKRGIELSKKYPFIYTTVGISPNDINENYKNEIKEIDKILSEYFEDKSKNVDYDINDENMKNVECDENEENAKNVECNVNEKNAKNVECDENEENAKNVECNVNEKNVETNKNAKNEQENKSIKSAKIVAVGEIGLDYHYDTEKEMQKDAFNLQIDLANKYNLPIVIHTREAVMDTLQILKQNPVKNAGIFHCCPFNRELVKEALKLGYYISFGGTCTFKNAKNAEEIVKMVPNNRFVIETDSPYLAPEPVRGTRNDSRNLKHIVKKIAEFKSDTEENIAKMSYMNACKAYKIKHSQD